MKRFLIIPFLLFCLFAPSSAFCKVIVVTEGSQYFSVDLDKGSASAVAQYSARALGGDYGAWTHSSFHLGDVVIPEKVVNDGIEYPVTEISDYAFTTILCLEKRDDNGDYIPYITHQGGSRFTSLTIPNSVKKIGTGSFSVCHGLNEVTIPNSVITIGENAFSSGGYSSLSIGDHVYEIGNGAFSSCQLLRNIDCHSTLPPTIDEGVFKITYDGVPNPNEVYDLATLRVPKGSLEVYQNAPGWKLFKHIEESDFSSTPQVSTDGGIIYRIDGRTISVEDSERSILIYDFQGKLLGQPVDGSFTFENDGFYILKQADSNDYTKVFIQ